MAAKMTANSLLETYRNQWETMTPGQRSAFKGNVRWLLNRTGDPDERTTLQQLLVDLGVTLPDEPQQYAGRTIIPPLWKLQLVRDANPKSDFHPHVRSPSDVADLLMQFIGNEPQEHLVVVLLDTKNRVIGINTVYIGNVNTVVVRMAEIFRPALLANATSIILSHNHPSGDPTPSPEDVNMTQLAVEAGKLLDIAVLDHVVVGHNRHVSLKERGLGF